MVWAALCMEGCLFSQVSKRRTQEVVGQRKLGAWLVFNVAHRSCPNLEKIWTQNSKSKIT